MTPPHDDRRLIPADVFQRSLSDLSQLQKQLPEAVVVALAREVLERLARHSFKETSHGEDVVQLCEALIGPDAKEAPALIESHLRQGASVEDIYLTFLSPASLQLGKWWEDNTVTFADVTVGTGRIYAIMRGLRDGLKYPELPGTKSAFFASAPGDDHKLGLRMAADLARKDGWDIEIALDDAHEALLERMTSSGQLIFGISAGGTKALPDLARLVLALRVSVPNAYILVSGNIVAEDPESVQLMHVDGIARKYEDAMRLMDGFWRDLQRKAS